MRFKTIAFALIVSSAVFILGCEDKEDGNTIPVTGGGQLYFEATVTPPMDSAGFGFGHATGASAYYAGGLPKLIGGTYTTEAMSVAEGQVVPVLVSLQYQNVINGGSRCSNVQIKSILNGSQIDVKTYNMGNASALPFPDCPDGTYNQHEIIIP